MAPIDLALADLDS